MIDFHYKVPDVIDGHKATWELRLHCHGAPEYYIPCSHCGGTGKVKSYWGVEDNDACHSCRGSMVMRNPDWKGPYKPPQWLTDQLMKVMRDAWNRQQNEEFKLS